MTKRKPASDPLADVITAQEAATRLGISKQHVALLCRAGKLQGKLWGGRWLILRASALAFVPGKPGRPRKVPG